MQKGNISVQTENIFPIIKKYLYSDHEIFLRELIANAVDATQKLKALATFFLPKKAKNNSAKLSNLIVEKLNVFADVFSENEGGKYVISLEYDQEIPYGQYLETVDMIYKVVYSFRKELALKKYNVSYDQLGADLQKEIRKHYPMALSEAWIKN